MQKLKLCIFIFIASSLFPVLPAAYADLFQLSAQSEVTIEGVKYRIVKTLGKGTFNAIYDAVVISSGKHVALRLEGKEAASIDRQGLEAFYESEGYRSAKHLLQETTPRKVPIKVVSAESISKQGGAIVDHYNAVFSTSEIITPIESIVSSKKYAPLVTLANVDSMSEVEFRRALTFLHKLYVEGFLGIMEMAETGYMHRDIKIRNAGFTGTLNQFITHKANLVFFDFDLATEHSKVTNKTLSGAPSTMAPETLAKEQVFSPMGDIYSWSVEILRQVLGKSYMKLIAEKYPEFGELNTPVEIVKMLARVADNPARFELYVDHPITEALLELESKVKEKWPQATDLHKSLHSLNVRMMTGIKANHHIRLRSFLRLPWLTPKFRGLLESADMKIAPELYFGQCGKNLKTGMAQGKISSGPVQ